MSDAASKPAPIGRLRVAVHAVDPLRRTALSRVVAEAGHMIVGVEDAAEVVLADGDGPPGETRPVVTLGGADADLAGVLSRHAGAGQIDAALHTVKFHVESLFRKLGARTRTEAVAKASERRRHETITL
jgi:hypothetical protein